MTVELIYETHSITVDNERGVATGWLPGELSPAGRAGAQELRGRRRANSPAAVFVSDLARAVQTAEIAFGGTGIPLYRDVRLRECNYGALNGAPLERLIPRTRYIHEPFPGGQSYRDVVEQTRSFLRDLAAEWDGARVIVIAHSANRWALEYLLNGIPLEDLVDAPFNWQEGWRFVVSGGE